MLETELIFWLVLLKLKQQQQQQHNNRKSTHAHVVEYDGKTQQHRQKVIEIINHTCT